MPWWKGLRTPYAEPCHGRFCALPKQLLSLVLRSASATMFGVGNHGGEMAGVRKEVFKLRCGRTFFGFTING